MRVFVIIFLTTLIISCGNPATENNAEDTPQEEVTSTQNNNPANKTDKENSTATNLLEQWNKLEQEVAAIQKRVVEAKEDWSESYEEMQYPETVRAKLPEEDQKKLTFIYNGALEQGKKFDVVINEVNSWGSLWESQQANAAALKSKVEAGELTNQEEITNLAIAMNDSGKKVKAWNDQLNKMKAETVLLYNTVNGIIVKSGVTE